MQCCNGQWTQDDHLAAPDASSVEPLYSRILNLPLSPLSRLYSSTEFVRCSADGKEAALVSARLDIRGHFLRVSSKEGESAVDIRNLRVSVHADFASLSSS